MSDGPVERRGYRVRGRVQGVGFRWWTVQEARSLRLVGSVRNDSDGSVRIDAAGPAAALELLEERLRLGPTGARVDAVEHLDPAAGPLPDAFRVAP